MNHVYSDAARKALTESFEGCELKAYQDSVAIWTIGYGHTQGVKAGDVCTQAEADAWLEQDIQTVVDQVNRDLQIVITDHEFDSLIDFGFNLGTHALEGSTLWKKLNAGDFAGTAAEFPRWDMAGGKHIVGLLRRRKLEQYWFNLKDQS